jgi:hypothetical protein
MDMNKTTAVLTMVAAFALMGSGVVAVLQAADASSNTTFTIRQRQSQRVSGVGIIGASSQSACNVYLTTP